MIWMGLNAGEPDPAQHITRGNNLVMFCFDTLCQCHVYQYPI